MHGSFAASGLPGRGGALPREEPSRSTSSGLEPVEGSQIIRAQWARRALWCGLPACVRRWSRGVPGRQGAAICAADPRLIRPNQGKNEYSSRIRDGASRRASSDPAIPFRGLDCLISAASAYAVCVAPRNSTGAPKGSGRYPTRSDLSRGKGREPTSHPIPQPSPPNPNLRPNPTEMNFRPFIRPDPTKIMIDRAPRMALRDAARSPSAGMPKGNGLEARATFSRPFIHPALLNPTSTE